MAEALRAALNEAARGGLDVPSTRSLVDENSYNGKFTGEIQLLPRRMTLRI